MRGESHTRCSRTCDSHSPRLLQRSRKAFFVHEASPRNHVVLAPGFGGFDALGQIFYYAGVTLSFERWREKRREAGLPEAHVALHYFESLPTAGVRSRAMALRAFLEERAFRCVFQHGDRIALVGHSTGGLDLRQLLVNLNPQFQDSFRDVVKESLVTDDQLMALIDRLVFLSVPQAGTNIADFIRRFRTPIEVALDQVKLGLKLSHNRILDNFERWLLSKACIPAPFPDLVDAVRDAILETLPGDETHTPEARYRAALARAAYGELFGWLDNVSSDFFAIDDLAYEGVEGVLPTPARYDDAMRQAEQAAWRAAGITTRSYATIGRSPYDKQPRTRRYGFFSFPRLLVNLRPDDVADTDVVYRIAYAATAAGPFKPLSGNDAVLVNGQRRIIQAWENDGIVNTASMLWPDRDQTRLVHGDHGDIIGHYDLTGPKKTSESVTGRKNHSYDILGSSSGFKTPEFDAVWHDVFDFCA
jgi:triacylglycerol lipase